MTDSYYPPEAFGGLQHSTQALCQRLATCGVKAAVLAKLSPHGLTSLGHRAARKLNPGLGFRPDHRAGHLTYRVWDLLDQLDAVLDAFQPDLVVAQSGPRWDLVDRTVARGISVICYHHDVTWQTGATAQGAQHLISHLGCSDFITSRLRDKVGAPAVVVPPLIEHRLYDTRTSRREVVFVNPRLEKGSAIVWALAASRPDIRFRFIESWRVAADQRRGMRHRAAALGNVILQRPQQDMRPIYARARVLLAPSIVEEGFGRTVAEAQVSGIPVLCSNRGGLPEAAGPGGIVLPPDAGIDIWCRALSQLWDDTDTYQRLSDAARLHASRPDFAPSAVAQSFLRHATAHLSQSRNLVTHAAAPELAALAMAAE